MNRKCQIGFALLVIGLAACSGGGGTGATGTGGTSGTTGGTGGTGTCTPGDGVVCVLSISFSPVDMTVNKGSSVSWTWQQGVHNIVFDPPLSPGVDDIGAFSEGIAVRTFTTTGTFPYHCTIHGGVGTGMHGTITVP
jgi:plastocyanin